MIAFYFSYGKEKTLNVGLKKIIWYFYALKVFSVMEKKVCVPRLFLLVKFSMNDSFMCSSDDKEDNFNK